MLGTIYLLMQHNKPEYLNHQQHHCKKLIISQECFKQTQPPMKWVKCVLF